MSDLELKERGFKALVNALGSEDAERFVHLLGQDVPNYTDWQADRYADLSVRELGKLAMDAHERMNAHRQRVLK